MPAESGRREQRTPGKKALSRSARTRSGRGTRRGPRGRDGTQARAKRWSRHVTETSNALDLEPGVFSFDDPAKIARSLRRSAEASRRRKADPFRSAMSMLVFYVNRAGRNLPQRRRAVLERAKQELRALYDRPHRRGDRRRTP
jgi:hypothetical protein